MVSKMLAVFLVALCMSFVYGQNSEFGSQSSSNSEFGSQNNTSVWSPGRILQMALAVVESALLTLILLFPSVMDPAVSFMNNSIGTVGSRRRRAVRAALTDQAASFHNLLLDAMDKFEEMDAALSLEAY